MRQRTARLELVAADVLVQRFCSPDWSRRAAPVETAVLLAELSSLAAAPPRELVLAAANPGAHPGFLELLATARTLELPVTVECEAAWFDADTPGRLIAAGVHRVRIVHGGIRRQVYETVMRAPDTWKRAAQGLAHAIASPLEVEVVVPLLTWNRADIVPLLDWVLALPGRDSDASFLLAVPRVSTTTPAFRAALLPYHEVAPIAAEAFGLARRARIGFGFADHDAVPPCAAHGVLDAFGSVFHQSIRRQQHEPERELTRIAACGECSLRQTCRGVDTDYVALQGEAEFAAVPLETSTSWRLRHTHGADELDYKQISPFDNDSPGEGRTLLRINGHCQMACAFCFVDRTAGDLPLGTITAELDALAARHVDHIVFSGGEPTIHPGLPRLIEHARGLGYRTIEIQTNGIKCADADFARTLVDAGLTKATVSLHSMDGDTSDRITRMPKAFPRTVAGLHNLQRLGVETQLAHVITKENYRALPAFARGVLAEFAAGKQHLSICFAIAQGISDLVYSWVIPSFTEIRPFMRDALDQCRAAGVGFGGLIGQGGYPPCMLGGDMSYYEGVLTKVYRSPDFDQQFHKAAACASCDFDPYCIGVRQDYVRCYGDDELQPIRVAPEALAGATPLPARDPNLVQLGRRR